MSYRKRPSVVYIPQATYSETSKKKNLCGTGNHQISVPFGLVLPPKGLNFFQHFQITKNTKLLDDYHAENILWCRHIHRLFPNPHFPKIAFCGTIPNRLRRLLLLSNAQSMSRADGVNALISKWNSKC